MKSLYISFGMPFPVNNGTRIRNETFLKVLARMGQVTLLALTEPVDNTAEARRELARICHKVEAVEISLPKLLSFMDCIGRICALTSGQPYDAVRYDSPALKRCVEQLLNAETYDCIVCDEIFTLQSLPPDLNVPILLGKYQVGTVVMDRYIANENNPIKRAYVRLERDRTRPWEAEVCSRAAVIMACSELETQVLREMCPESPVTCVPNVVDTEAYVPASSERGRVILFQGAMDWYPNCEAVSFFISSILPLIHQQIPDAHLVVAGRGVSSSFKQQFSRSRVEFTGTVDDMRPHMAGAAVCIVPLRVGSGTRLKILEAGAMGKAVVSTRVGAEGLNFVDGREILLADSPEEFAAATINLLENVNFRNRIGSAARARVEAEYSLKALERSLDRALSQIRKRASVRTLAAI